MTQSNDQAITEQGETTEAFSELYKEIEDAVNQHMLRTGKWPSHLRIGEAIWDQMMAELQDLMVENTGEQRKGEGEFLGIPVSIVSREKDPSDFFRYAMQ